MSNLFDWVPNRFPGNFHRQSDFNKWKVLSDIEGIWKWSDRSRALVYSEEWDAWLSRPKEDLCWHPREHNKTTVISFSRVTFASLMTWPDWTFLWPSLASSCVPKSSPWIFIHPFFPLIFRHNFYGGFLLFSESDGSIVQLMSRPLELNLLSMWILLYKKSQINLS